MVCEVAMAPLDARATVTVADASPATALGAAGAFGMRAPEVITRFARSLETATNTPLPYVTKSHGLSAADAREFQVIPSRLVITRLPAPEVATATNTPFPYVTEFQLFSVADTREVQVIPSGLVITRLPAPLPATATNSPFPYVTPNQLLSAADTREVQAQILEQLQ